MEQTLKDAIYVFGPTAQKRHAIEEMAELIKEICKDLDGHGKPENIAEEIADVGIMLDQLVMIYDDIAEVARFRAEKIERLRARVFEARYD